MVEIRAAAASDEEALAAIDRATWSSLTSPAAPPGPAWRFFDARCRPEDVLVALVDARPVGYVRTGRATELGASDHVLHISGFAVSADRRRSGIGRALLEAAIDAARKRAARRVTLRVLAHNEAARALYESRGFVVEGVLHGEFFLDGAYVDDLWMALDLTAGLS